ncbi:rho GTPase-activating protein 23-like isoform X2 [Clytia hemisphaerica]|uniref:Uncharacterized protein n=1 Tax=Clytia hemisphaerica TaxID=252671 RepID=A0A7M5V9Z6_9CNID
MHVRPSTHHQRQQEETQHNPEHNFQQQSYTTVTTEFNNNTQHLNQQTYYTQQNEATRHPQPATPQRPWNGPVTFTLRKRNEGYGFTLRYFVVYPPTPQKSSFDDSSLDRGFNRDSYWLANGLNDANDDDEAFVSYAPAPLDTFFVKNVTKGGSADEAGLKSGDRIVSINGDLIGGKRYKDVVELVQYCSGDLKLGVVPHQEDILQLVYQEYIYDDNKTITDQQQSRSSNDDPQHAITQRLSTSSMSRPSVNKWAAPLVPRKSVSIDNNNGGGGSPNMGTMSHGTGGGSGSSDNSNKRYDPCVTFFAGTPVISPDSKQSRSNSVTSSGSITPNWGKGSGKGSGKATPKRASNGSGYDPCVPWVGGKPMVSNIEESTQETVEGETFGIPPYKLQNALRKEQGKKPYSVGTRLAPKQITGVSKPGAVSNIAGLFANGNWEELSPRKKSATSVLRDDFQMMKRGRSESTSDAQISQQVLEPSAQFDDGPMKFNLNVTVDNKRRTSESEDINRSPFDRNNPSYSSLPARYHRSLSSNTSQATLVESRKPKPKDGVAALAMNTMMLNGGRDKVTSPVTLRKRNLLGRGGRKTSVSSSVENSEDEESHGESGDENGDLDNWKGRRISYLAATAKQNEKNTSGAENKIPVDTQEADDEDSDAHASPQTNQRLRSNQKSNTDEIETKPVKKEGPLNRKLVRSLDPRKKASTRTWKPMYAVLKGHRLFCYKNSGDGDDDIIQPIPIRGSIIEILSHYPKRRHVFRLITSHGNEYLFQSEDSTSMMSWVHTLRDANPDKESLMKTSSQLNQENEQKANSKDKKGLSIRRSNFLRSSKKGRSSSNPNPKIPKLPMETAHPAGKTFGIPLHKCSMSKTQEKVPLIVEHCCTVIEEKADTVGIYRIPGNAATIQSLRSELDTKDPDDIQWDDEKWQEVHNISTLLKAFLRQLDDPIVPSNMYTKFITVNRFTDQRDRLKSIKHLTRNLPDYHLETLQFLLRHLKLIAEHSEHNKMDLKNLVTLFGPNIVKSDEVTSLVQDMADQCKIIETLIKQFDWIFNDDAEGGEPIECENGGEIISSGISKALIECLNQNQKSPEQDINENVINNNNNKKSNKFSTLRNNFSMKLKSSKVTSPKSQKKKSGNISQEEDPESDDETSGCYSQSPPSSGKVEKRSAKFKTKETRHVGNKLTMIIPSRQTSDNNSGHLATQIGQFTMNSDVQINFTPGPRSPELSPSTNRLTENTMNHLNQSNKFNQQTSDYDFKPHAKDDGCDSGVTSPQQMASDDSDSGAHSSRKESLESLSGPSPRIQRRFPPQRQLSNSGSSNEERSPTLTTKSSATKGVANRDTENKRTNAVANRSIRRAHKSRTMNNDKRTETDGSGGHARGTKVVKRSDSAVRRRQNYPNSPRSGKRNLKSIIPGDGNDYEEQLRLMLDGEVDETVYTQTETSEVAQKPDTLEIPNSRVVVLSGAKTPDSGHNAEWWLSGNQNNYRRFLSAPKDKASAISILSNVIDNSRKRNSKEGQENELHSPSTSNVSEFSNRVNTHRQRNDEFEKKVTGILSTSPVNSYTDIKQFNNDQQYNDLQSGSAATIASSLTSNSASSVTESRSEKLDRYLQQVAMLLSQGGTQESQQEKERIAQVLKQFERSAGGSAIPQSHGMDNQRLHSDSSVPTGNAVDRTEHKAVTRTRSSTNSRKVVRTSPLLDDTYSQLNYAKLYP